MAGNGMGAVSWSRGKKTADRGNLDTSPKALMALRAGSREYCNSELQYSPLSAVFFPQLQLTAPKTLPAIPMSGSGSLVHQVRNNAQVGRKRERRMCLAGDAVYWHYKVFEFHISIFHQCEIPAR